MLRGFTVLTFVPGSYIVLDPVGKSVPVKFRSQYFNCFFLAEVTCYLRVMMGLGYLCLSRVVFQDVQSILVI